MASEEWIGASWRNPMASPQVSAVPTPLARVALVGLDEFSENVFRSCLSQFGILGVSLANTPANRLITEKFEGCAIVLDEPYLAYLQALRSSALNDGVVVYGIDAGKNNYQLYSTFRINAVLKLPLDRQEALAVVRASRSLLVHELRRYVRLPLAIPINLMSAGTWYKARCEQISWGGMALKSDWIPKRYAYLILSFELPNYEKVSITAQVCWNDAHGHVGVRFTQHDPARQLVKAWIERYLQIA
jgi:hypothetical protein